MTGLTLRCATWNIHRAKGADGRVDPDRIADAIETTFAPLGLDVLALQEADEDCPPHARIIDVARIAEETGLRYQHDDAGLRWGPQSDGFLGTILFLNPKISCTFRDVVDLPGHCHRGVVVLEVETAQGPLRLVSGHLSLSQPLRIVQMRTVGQYIFRRTEMPNVLLGDFNEWRPWGGLMFHKRLVGRAFTGPARRTFPARWPLLPLDRILSDKPGAISDVRALTSDALRMASDHLPLVGEVTLS